MIRSQTLRRRVFTSRVGNAERCFGDIAPDEHIVGLTNGQFSMIDAVEHLAKQVSAQTIDISTWTTGVYDLERLAAFRQATQGAVIRIVVDKTIFRSRPEYSSNMIKVLGEECFRFAPVHAKVCVIRGKFGAAMRGSLNLNRNERTENIDCNTDDSTVQFFADWFDALWDAAEGGEGKSAVIKGIFERIPDTAAVVSPHRSARDVFSKARRWGD
jgi:hypothetical protein